MDTAATPVPGRFRLLGPDGAELETAEAVFAIEPGALVVQPKLQPVLRVDFADVDGLTIGDYVFTLALSTGEKVEVSMAGRRTAELTDATAEALRTYQAKNLLLEEPVGGEAFQGDLVRDGKETPVEVRVYATSLAVVPRAEVPFGVPFGDVTGVSFDENKYSVDLQTGLGPLSFLRLGKQTQPFLRLVESRLSELRKRNAAAISFLLPKLPSITARRLAQVLSDGVPARQAELDAISPAIWPSLLENAAGDPKSLASLQALVKRSVPGESAVGLKETNARQDTDEAEPDSDEKGEADEAAGEGETPMTGRVAWFLFPLAGEDQAPSNAIAVEAATRGGRATYLFRVAEPEAFARASADERLQAVREQIRIISKALVALTFKREPIYLPQERIESPAYARYRLALRLSVPLATARASFLGRAIHGPGWEKQIESALARS